MHENKAAADRSAQVSVIVVDDQDLIRSGMRLILSSYEHIKVVGEARDGHEAISVIRRTHPDVAVMDIRMPIMDGIAASAAISSDPQLKSTKILIVTTFDHDEYVYQALVAGASGFMLKDSEPDDIANAISVIAQGEALIQPSITKRLIEQYVVPNQENRDSSVTLDALTARELEIFELVGQGVSNEAIADKLEISPATVKTHVARVMAKLDAHDRAQLVVYAYESGLVVAGRA